MKELSGTFTSKGQLVIPAELRRKHKIQSGTKVRFLEDDFGRIILQPITEEYIDRVCGMLTDGPDYLALWEREHRAEKDLSDKVARRSQMPRTKNRRLVAPAGGRAVGTASRPLRTGFTR